MNIFTMFQFLEMHNKMTGRDFEVFKSVFMQLLEDNKPDAAHNMIQDKIKELGI